MSQSKTTVQIPTLETFLKAGVHFGHKTSTWNPRMEEYIYGERNGIHIIDIIKMIHNLKEALAQIEEVSDVGHVMFVGTKGQAVSVIEKVSQESGALYINTRWPGGLFTNFNVVKKGIERLISLEETLASGAEGLVKKETLLMQREVERLNRLYSGIKLMDKLPKLLIVIDSKLERIAIREAQKVGVPVIALLDTNCDPTIVDYPIPANDDSIKSITLFVELFGEAIKKGKKSKSLVELRKNYEAQLQAKKMEFDNAIAREKALKEAEEKRLKRLKFGVEDQKKEELDKEILDLALGSRVEKALEEAGIFTLKDLKTKKEADLMKLKGLGGKTVKDIISKIK
jgi:small subunit ribosomal protein S2